MALNLAPKRSETARVGRSLRESDRPELARLMLDAYRNTIDDEGGSLDDASAEVEKTLSGGYGRALLDASFVVDSHPPGRLLSASIVTLFQDEPLLAFSMTTPEAQRTGLAGSLIAQSAEELTRQGYERLWLVVTNGNRPAESLYRRLGFHPVARGR